MSRPPDKTPAHRKDRFEALIEIGEQAENVAGKVHNSLDWANKGLRVYSGYQAFRKYSWLTGAAKNVSGNFRGMVVNRDAKTLFDITGKNAEYLKFAGDALVLAALAIEIGKNTARFHNIMNSSDDSVTKAQKLSIMTSMVITRTLTSPLVPAVHVVARTLERACSLSRNATSCTRTLEGIDATVKSTYEKVTDDDTVLHYINAHLVFAP